MSISSIVRTGLLLGAGMAFLAGSAAAETHVRGTLEGKTEWTKTDSPYIVMGDIVIPAGSSLHIGPGVTVRFKPNIASREGYNEFDLEIYVQGLLVVEGARNDTTILTTDANRADYGDWQGIVVWGPEARAELNAAKIEFANDGIHCYQGEIDVRNSTIWKCGQNGVVLMEGRGEFDNVLLTNIANRGGTGIGINVDRGSVVTVRNSFLVGVQNGISFSRSSSGTVDNTLISLCAKRGVLVRNSNPTITACTITGNDLGFNLSANATPVIQGNNIFENATYDVTVSSDYEGDPVKLDMTGNWWGETSLGLIEERILDGLDNEDVKAFVVIDPVLTEAVVHEESSKP